MGTNVQSLKAAMASRVVPAQSTRIGSQVQNLGEGLTCPAGSGDINFDIYGRPATKNTLDLRDSACSQYTGITAARFMQYETNHRPHVPICAAGLRGASDMMGVGRDVIPRNIYETGFTPFHRSYPMNPNNAPPQGPYPQPFKYQRRVQPWDMGMDGTNYTFRG